MVQDDCKDCAPRRQLAAAVSASGRVTVPAAAALTPRYLGWMRFWRALGAVARRGRTARFGQAAAAAPPLLLPQLLQPVMRHHQQLPPRLARLFSTSTIDNASILGEQNADSSFIDSVAPSGRASFCVAVCHRRGCVFAEVQELLRCGRRAGMCHDPTRTPLGSNPAENSCKQPLGGAAANLACCCIHDSAALASALALPWDLGLL